VTLSERVRGIAVIVAITAATLVLADVLCNVLHLFPPVYDYGDPELGWRAAAVAPAVHDDRCVDPSGTVVRYARNEDGIRTALSVAELRAERRRVKIAVTGDSQTDLCAPNADVHSGVLERELEARGVRAIVLPYGVGRYSPLQDYLAFRDILKKYGPRVLVLNFYTGNDFYDLLRIDDRPHFVRRGSGYDIAGPVWYRYDDPRVRRRSRVWYLLRSVAAASGLRNLMVHVRFVYRTAVEEGGGPRAVVAYLRDLRRSVEPSVPYHEAFAAQFLNQQLFFHWFPGARGESLARVRALLELARRENPGTLLVLSALPSYELVARPPVDSALLRTLRRLPLTYEGGVREEQRLYEALRRLAGEAGWVFVDNLAALRAFRGTGRLYNDVDYHLLPAASAIIGKAQAAALLPLLGPSRAGTGRACCGRATR
jgi:hypothetical protein